MSIASSPRTAPLPKKGHDQPREPTASSGAAWYSAGRQVRKAQVRRLRRRRCRSTSRSPAAGSRMLQHHFFAALDPGRERHAATFSLATPRPTAAAVLDPRARPGVNVAPGATAPSTTARLWVGPKLVKQIEAQNVPGLTAPSTSAATACAHASPSWLFWLLREAAQPARQLGLGDRRPGGAASSSLLYPLSAAQYKSMAKMRKFQPRIEAAARSATATTSRSCRWR